MIFGNAFMSTLDFELTNADNASACTTGFSRPMPKSAQTCRVFPKQQMLSWRKLLVCRSTTLKYVCFVTPLIPWQKKLSSTMSSRITFLFLTKRKYYKIKITPPSLIFWQLQIGYTLTLELFLRHSWWASKYMFEWSWNIICVQATNELKKVLAYNYILSAGGPPKVTSFFSML